MLNTQKYKNNILININSNIDTHINYNFFFCICIILNICHKEYTISLNIFLLRKHCG